MEELIETIRAATIGEATDDARAAGAQACRTLLAALAATPGEPLVSAPSSSDAALAAPTPALASPHVAAQAIASMLRGMTPDQLLDLAIARLRAALPAGADVPRPQPVKFQLVPVHR